LASLAMRSTALSAYRAIHQAAEGREAKIELLEMLLDGLAASLAGIRNAELSGDLGGRQSHIVRASRILVGLEKALDPRFNKELTESLGALYKYFLRRLNRISSQNASNTVDELLGYTNTLRSAFLPKN